MSHDQVNSAEEAFAMLSPIDRGLYYVIVDRMMHNGGGLPTDEQALAALLFEEQDSAKERERCLNVLRNDNLFYVSKQDGTWRPWNLEPELTNFLISAGYREVSNG